MNATTVTLMKWVMIDGQWVRRCFDLTSTPQGKSDKPATDRKVLA